MRSLSISLIIAGFLLMVLSPLWPSVASSSLFWDDASARNYNESVANLHQAHVQASLENDRLSPDDGNDSGQAVVRAPDPLPGRHRFDEDQRKLVNARQFHNTGGRFMRWLGVAIAVIGLGIFQWHKSATD